MRRTLRGAVLVAAAAVVAGCQPVQPWSSELASVDATGADSTELGVSDGVISPDGTKVAFVTESSDLGPTDTNGVEDVYVRDLSTGETTLISVNETGTDSGNGRSVEPQFSADGARIAFRSSAGDLAPDAPDEADRRPDDVFVHDLSAGQTTQVALSTPLGCVPDPVSCREGVHSFAMSDDFQHVVYTSTFDEFFGSLHVHDMATGESVQIDYHDGGYEQFVYSPDGSKVAFTTYSELDPRDSNAISDIYVIDLTTNAASLVSVNKDGTSAGSGPAGARGPSFSPDSAKIMFHSNSDDLVSSDANGWTSDVFVRDLDAESTTLVSVDANGDGANADSFEAEFTGDGNAVVFTSWASDLGPTDANGTYDVYHRDLTTGTTTLVSANAEGTDSGNGPSRVVRGDLAGGRVAFFSTADDLGPGDTNSVEDLYAWDPATGATTLVSTNATGIDSGNAVTARRYALPVSADGRRVALLTEASDLGANDTNGEADIYVATLRLADVALTADASPEPVVSGGTLSYQLDVSNLGPDSANDLVAALVLPEDTEFADVSTTTGSCEPPTVDAPRVVTCAFGSPDVGHVASVTVDAVVTAPAGASLEAVALARSSIVDGAGDNNRAVLESAVA